MRRPSLAATIILAATLGFSACSVGVTDDDEGNGGSGNVGNTGNTGGTGNTGNTGGTGNVGNTGNTGGTGNTGNTGGTGGTIPATCGNGVIDDGETCDGLAFGGQDCTDHGYAEGFLGCSQDCQTVDDSFCTMDVPSICGNDVVDGAFEQCDGTDLGSATGYTCVDYGFTAGEFACKADCTMDYSGCTGDDVCTLAGWYDDGYCDPCELWGGAPDGDCDGCGDDGTCVDWLSSDVHTTTCTWVTGTPDPDCVNCGDDVADPDEWCDGTDLGYYTCTDFGFAGGSIACDGTCRYDLSGCLTVLPPEDVCNNWLDDDNDTFIDCEDTTNCQGTSACTPGNGAVGVVCTDPTNCASLAGNDPTCLDATNWGVTNGYCSEFCNLANDDCGALSICVDAQLASGNGLCVKRCTVDNDCRPADDIFCVAVNANDDLGCWLGVPQTWTCSPSYYGTGDGCDCGCGVLDPDCASAARSECEYCDNDGSCSSTVCPGTINATENWHC